MFTNRKSSTDIFLFCNIVILACSHCYVRIHTFTNSKSLIIAAPNMESIKYLLDPRLFISLKLLRNILQSDISSNHSNNATYVYITVHNIKNTRCINDLILWAISLLLYECNSQNMTINMTIEDIVLLKVI